MKHDWMIAISLLMMSAGVLSASEPESTTYGSGITLDEAVPIATLLGNPELYAGKKVRVDGVVSGVCKKMGCWMQVSNPDTAQSIRVKVEDGVIVFPYSAIGHRASAEGVFEIVKLTPEQIEARKAHQEKELEESKEAKAEGKSGEGHEHTKAEGKPCEGHKAAAEGKPCEGHEHTNAEGKPCEGHKAGAEGKPCEGHKAAAEGKPCEGHKAAAEGKPCEGHKAGAEGKPGEGHSGPVEDTIYLLRCTGAVIHS